MFISRNSPYSQTFVVAGGFRSPDRGTLDVLSASGARLLVGTREYIVDERRFGKGVNRIPFDELSPRPKQYLSLKNSPLSLESVWGLPEDCLSIMVFTRDMYTGQGKRVRRGEEVTYEEPVYLLAQGPSAEYVAKRIPGCAHVGHVQCRLGGSTLQVLTTRIPSEACMTSDVLTILEAEGIAVGKSVSVPELIWPPALRADGMERTLPGYGGAIFATSVPRPGDDRLYIYSGSSVLDDGSSSRKSVSQDGQHGYASVALSETGLLITETQDSFEQAIMLEASDEALYSQMRSYDVGFESSDEGMVARVRLTRPLGVAFLRPNLPTTRKSKTGEWHTFDVGRTGIVRVVKKLDNRNGIACLWQHLPSSDGHVATLKDSPVDTRLSMCSGRDVALAAERKLGVRIGIPGRDRSFAAVRRSRQ